MSTGCNSRSACRTMAARCTSPSSAVISACCACLAWDACCAESSSTGQPYWHPNAGWMQARLTELFGDVAEIRPNPFGVTPAWFDMRRQIGEPREWLVVTRITRKKLGDLLRWGKGLFGPHRRLRLLGPMQEDIALPAWIEYGGPTNPDNLRQQWFPGAAGLLTLSRHDEGRPQVMIEAMAAGLPVIASRIPAHADLIRHGGPAGWWTAATNWPKRFAKLKHRRLQRKSPHGRSRIEGKRSAPGMTTPAGA